MSQGGVAPESGAQYAQIIKQYDDLVKEVSYKGVNLLSDENLTLSFGEDISSKIVIVGKNASSANLGLTTLDWQNIQDVTDAIKEISSAMTQIRTMSAELGNSYSLVTTRQTFTENLINVLTDGSEQLTLADMNEESAYILALQTRQQLAVNSLSLASDASLGILKLFYK